eukprot:TRINITY_DN85_c0_g1_i5.p1 TRINITY_DN85_c0_g1~~TRINITY_DN85_c0_g1_i5.p1  ORF type:complete len:148 (+),score=13.03 TRINITY_DN85_c0_g1_i5:259-702(+)
MPPRCERAQQNKHSPVAIPLVKQRPCINTHHTVAKPATQKLSSRALNPKPWASAAVQSIQFNRSRTNAAAAVSALMMRETAKAASVSGVPAPDASADGFTPSGESVPAASGEVAPPAAPLALPALGLHWLVWYGRGPEYHTERPLRA